MPLVAFSCAIIALQLAFPISCVRATSTPTSNSQSGMYFWRPVHDKLLSVETIINKPLSSKSLMKCIIDCVHQIKHCNVVIYHRKAQTCKPGYGIIRPNGRQSTGSSATTSADEVIYSKTLNTCDISRGFSMQYSSRAILCKQTFPTRLNYTMAERVCQNKGGRVLALHDSYMLSLIRGITDSVYIGLHKKWPGFFWTDGQELSRGTSAWSSLWAPGQPTNSSHGCVILGKSYKMFSVTCGMLFGFICEVPII